MKLYEVNEVCRFCDKDCKQGLEVGLECCGHAFKTYRELIKESEDKGINKYQLWMNKYEPLGATKQDCMDYFGVTKDAVYKALKSV